MRLGSHAKSDKFFEDKPARADAKLAYVRSGNLKMLPNPLLPMAAFETVKFFSSEGCTFSTKKAQPLHFFSYVIKFLD